MLIIPVLNKIFFPMNEIFHGFLFGGLMMGYTLLMNKKWPINYERMNLYCFVSFIIDLITFLTVSAMLSGTED